MNNYVYNIVLTVVSAVCFNVENRAGIVWKEEIYSMWKGGRDRQ